MAALNKKLLLQLECPVCFETCVPPIYMCVNGHCVCARCQAQLSECSTCRAPGKPRLRCMQLERIAEMVEVPCTNKRNGCDFSFNMDELAKHLPWCEYGYECLVCKDWKGPATDLKAHVADNHKLNIINLPSTGEITKRTRTFAYDSRVLMLISHGDTLFWIELTNIGRVISCPMWLVSHSPTEASKFYFSLEFPSSVGKLKVTYQGEILNLSDNARSEDTEFTIPTGIVDSYKDKAVVFHLSIKSK